MERVRPLPRGTRIHNRRVLAEARRHGSERQIKAVESNVAAIRRNGGEVSYLDTLLTNVSYLINSGNESPQALAELTLQASYLRLARRKARKEDVQGELQKAVLELKTSNPRGFEWLNRVVGYTGQDQTPMTRADELIMKYLNFT